jgi:hypothetical protein
VWRTRPIPTPNKRAPDMNVQNTIMYRIEIMMMTLTSTRNARVGARLKRGDLRAAVRAALTIPPVSCDIGGGNGSTTEDQNSRYRILLTAGLCVMGRLKGG